MKPPDGWDRSEVARAFGLPEHLINDDAFWAHSTYSAWIDMQGEAALAVAEYIIVMQLARLRVEAMEDNEKSPRTPRHREGK